MTEQSELQHQVDMIAIQQKNRKQWSEEDDAESVVLMLQVEVGELVEAIVGAFLSGDVFSVGAEIADVLYLIHRLCHELGFDPADLLAMKSLRNSMKYADYLLNNGYTKDLAVTKARSGWKAMGGDEAFSHAYLNVYADLEDNAPTG